ncbi:conserved hypothetical protein [Ricinus communis]|uniref:Uncharacterized protein n=1 Tax=Ricinus communis TaxID=3988 RepID=B9S6W5_RICCO|nr:conserved hypothetical protein [Ricinus communis]
MESRVHVLLAYPSWGLEVLEVAKHLSSSSLQAMDDVQAVLTLRIDTPDSQQKRKFVSGWCKLISRKAADGSIKFLDRNLIHPAYEVINVIGTGLKRIGPQL